MSTMELSGFARYFDKKCRRLSFSWQELLCSGLLSDKEYQTCDAPSSSASGVSKHPLLHLSIGMSRPQASEDDFSHITPLLDSVRYEVRYFSGSASTVHNGYDGPPTSELEEAWQRLEDSKYTSFVTRELTDIRHLVPAVLIPTEHVASMNRSIEQGFVRSEETGKEGYIATVEVFHHLHCLNVVRQFVWREAYPAGLVPWLLEHNSALVAREHVGHCIGILREALMCNADLAPYLWYEGKGAKAAREDF